jgi:ubiquinone/menaquinone biosynthesis C-methylase UbiE
MLDKDTAAVAAAYDKYQHSLEQIDKLEKYLNYGYSNGGRRSLVERQTELCRRVFDLAAIEADHVVVDVGFGSGEQDFLLAREVPFARLHGFNIAERQVDYARRRAEVEGLARRLRFHHAPAERMTVLPDDGADRLLAIECAFHFDRPQFYAEAARVLRPGGRVVLADFALGDPLGFLTRFSEECRRAGTVSGNRSDWERHFITRSRRRINRHVLPGAQQAVFGCLSSLVRGLELPNVMTWLNMGLYTQVIVFGLVTGLLSYELIVLEKPAAAA